MDIKEAESLARLEKKFKCRYESLKILKGREQSAQQAKRSWLDVKKELRR